jgi:hypothetical protein
MGDPNLKPAMSGRDQLRKVHESMSPYFKISNGETRTVTYLGVEAVPSPFKSDNGKMTKEYTLGVGGRELKWTTKSQRLYDALVKAGPNIGDKIELMAVGDGTDRIYSVKVVE